MGWFNKGQKVTEYGAVRARRKHGLAWYVVGAFAFAIELMLGINVSFLVDQSLAIVTHNMLDGTILAVMAPVIALIVALAIGFLFVFGGMWTFAGFLDSLDDARAYADKYATPIFWGRIEWPVTLVWLMIIAVILLDYTTLIFRAAYFAEKGAGALFWFFVILILMPPILGCMLHVLEHTPRDRRRVKADRDIEAIDADEYEQTLYTMPHDLRTRHLDGDALALGEHYQTIEEQREAARQQELDAIETRNAEREARRRESEEKKRNALVPASKRGQRPFPLPSQKNHQAS